MNVDLEIVLTHPSFFGLVTASPCQLAAVRIVEGESLGELASDPNVVAMVGGASALAMLPSGVRPRECCLYSGVRTGKSLLAAALAVRAALTVDVSHLRPGEVPRVPVVSLDVDKARVVLQHIRGALASSSALRAQLIEDTADTIILRHHTGRPVEITVTAGRRAGGSLVARWLAGAIFDEAPRMLGSDDGAVVNLTDCMAAVEGRLLDGAQIIKIGSPWAPFGPSFEDCHGRAGEEWRERWGRPSARKVVLVAGAPALNPSWWTPQRCAELKEKNPRVYKTDVLAQFADAETSIFDAEVVDAAMAPRTTTRIIEEFDRTLIIDASRLRLEGDAWSYAIVRWVREELAGLPAPPDGEWNLNVADRICQERWIEATNIAPGYFERSIQRQSTTGVWHVYQPLGAARPVLEIEEVGEIPPEGDTEAAIDFLKRLAARGWRRGWSGTERIRRVVGDQFEAGAIGALLRRSGFKFTEVKWSAASKAAAVDRLTRLLRDRAVRLHPNAKLRQQLLEYVERITRTGSIKHEGRGRHDDLAQVVLSATMADVAGLLKGSPTRASKERFEAPVDTHIT